MTFAAIILFLKNHRRGVLIFIGIVVLVVGSAIIYHSCTAPPVPHIDEQELQDAQVDIEQRNDEKLRQRLANSDAQLILAETNNNAAAANTVAAGSANYSNMNTSELAAELERRANQ
jgi:hypothetical protein